MSDLGDIEIQTDFETGATIARGFIRWQSGARTSFEHVVFAQSAKEGREKIAGAAEQLELALASFLGGMLGRGEIPRPSCDGVNEPLFGFGAHV